MMLRSKAGQAVKQLALGRRSLSTSEAAGIKVTSHEDGRPTSELSLVVKAGSRFEPSPGVAYFLEKFAFRDTAARSALRFTREAELLGGSFSTKLTPEYLVLTTKFLREDLPYFVDELSAVAESTLFHQYELDEVILPLAKLEETKIRGNSIYAAIEAAHEVAFRKGLGNPTLATPSVPVTIADIKDFASKAYTKANVSVFAKGVGHEDLTEFVTSKFGSLASGQALSSAEAGKFGGEARIKSSSSLQAAVIAFPTTTRPCLTALKHILQRRGLKWSTGTGLLDEVAAKYPGTTIKIRNYDYSDASLFSVVVFGDSAENVAAATKESAAVIKNIASSGVSAEKVQLALARAKLKAADKLEPQLSPVVDLGAVTADTVKAKADALVKGKVALAVVGQTHLLPHVDELF